MQLWDIAVTGAIVVLAVWYLYRKFVVGKGCTCGSACRNCPGTKEDADDFIQCRPCDKK